jgi:hypothetical protein
MLPPPHFWFTGAALFLAGSFAFTVLVGLIGIRQMISNRIFMVLLIVAAVLSALAWRTAAKQAEDEDAQQANAATLSGQLTTITASNKKQEEQLAKVATQNSELQGILAKIAGAADVSLNQSANEIAAAVIAKIEPLQKEVEALSKRPSDELYQDGLPLGKIVGLNLNADKTIASFQAIGTERLIDFGKEVELQGARLSCNSVGPTGFLRMGITVQYTYSNVTCKVLGPR